MPAASQSAELVGGRTKNPPPPPCRTTAVSGSGRSASRPAGFAQLGSEPANLLCGHRLSEAELDDSALFGYGQHGINTVLSIR